MNASHCCLKMDCGALIYFVAPPPHFSRPQPSEKFFRMMICHLVLKPGFLYPVVPDMCSYSIMLTYATFTYYTCVGMFYSQIYRHSNNMNICSSLTD